MEALGEPWGRPGRAGGGPGGVLGGPGAVLEAYKRHLGGSLGRLGAILGALEAMLEPSGGQKVSKIEPKRVPNPAPEATRVENCENLMFDDSTQVLNDFGGPGAPFCNLKQVPNGFQIAASTLKALRKPLEASWSALEVVLEAS